MAQARRSYVFVGLLVLALVGVVVWSWIWGGHEAAVGGAESEAEGVAGVGPRDRPEQVDARLAGRGSAISGTIRDPQGQPVVGATVCVLASGPRLARADRQPLCSASGRDGHYRVDGLLAIRHRVSAMAPRFVPAFYTSGVGIRRRDTIDLRPGQETRGIDIRLEAGGVEIHGVVQDVSGGPIEGARVSAGGVGAGTGVSIASSGPDGGFSLWVRPGRMTVWSDTDGYAQGYSEGAAPGHHFELFLTPEAVVIGKVVRVGDGSPVADAEVWVERGDSSSVIIGGGGGAAITDGAGNFRVEGLMPGAYKARAVADDALGVAAEQVVLGLGETSKSIVIQAHPASFAEGRIVVVGGDDCDDGSVHLRDATHNSEGFSASEPDGQLRVRGLLPGNYEVTVRCPGHLLAESYPVVVVGAANVMGLRWEVERGQAIRGVVVDARGKPARGLEVGAYSKPDPSRPRTRQGAASQSSDEEGRFELAGLRADSYQVTVNSWRLPRAVPAEPIDVVVPDGQDVDDLRIELPASGEVRGSVRDAKGQPVTQVQVQILATRGTQTMMTADDGSFHFPEMGAGEHRLVASRAGNLLRPPGASEDDPHGRMIVVEAGKVETVNLVVEGTVGRISGVVRDEGGALVVDAFIEASREPESAAAAAGEGARARWRSAHDRPRVSDTDGRFTIDGLLPGKYAVRAQRRGGGEALVEHVALGQDVALTIAATGRLAGIVSLGGGGVPAQFSARLIDRATGFSRNDNFFRTGGAWSFTELPEGSYELSVDAPEGTQKLTVPLAAGEVREGVAVELAGQVKVRGTVVDLEGAPVAGVEVRVSSDGSVRFGMSEADRRHVTDEAGRYEIDRAPVGVVSLVAWPPPGGEYGSAWRTTRIAGGQTEVTLPPIRVVKKRVADGAVAGDLGFTFKRAGPTEDALTRRLVVAVVRAGGPAAAAELKVGDEVATIDGHDVTGENSYLQSSLLTIPAGAVVRLGLARGVTVAITASKAP